METSYKYHECVAYNVELELGDNEELLTKIRKQQPETLSVKRIEQYPNFKPTTIIRIRTNTKENLRKLLSNGVQIEDKKHRTGFPKKQDLPRRCYKCQKISDHLARNCPEAEKCMRCAGPHSKDKCNSNFMKCANCDGGHQANSIQCKKWTWEFNRRKRTHELYTEEIITRITGMEKFTKDHFKRSMEKQFEIEAKLNDIVHMMMDVASAVNIRPVIVTSMEPEQLPVEQMETISEQEPEPVPVPKPPSTSTTSTTTTTTTTPQQQQTTKTTTTATKPKNYATKFSLQPRASVNTVNRPEKVKSDQNTKKSESEILKNHLSRWNPQKDRVYTKFYEKVYNLDKEKIQEFKEKFNYYADEVCFRYDGGKIGKQINVRTIDGIMTDAYPCSLDYKRYERINTEKILCCAYHHLAAEIRKNTDVTTAYSIAESTRKWRVKDTSRYCLHWQIKKNVDDERKWKQQQKAKERDDSD